MKEPNILISINDTSRSEAVALSMKGNKAKGKVLVVTIKRTYFELGNYPEEISYNA